MKLYTCSYVHSGDQMMLGSIVTFLVEIECCKAIYKYIPCGDQLM